MSMWVKCEICGKLKEVPAYEGDGTYHDHDCQPETERKGERESEEAPHV